MTIVVKAAVLIVGLIIADACRLAWKLKGESDCVIQKQAWTLFENRVLDALVLVPICAYFFTR